jgi:oligoendopeptidase F
MDYAAFGTTAGTDVAEIFSQGMEYLSLTDDLVELKLADSLSIYVEQGAYAAFELAMYALPEEEVTGENLLALYEEIGTAYGFESWDWDSRDLVTVPHFYEYPMYVISYVVSNDAAMQLYQMELQTPGSGAAVYLDQLATGEQTLLSFLASAGLRTPFGRTEEVRAIMEAHFG